MRIADYFNRYLTRAFIAAVGIQMIVIGILALGVRLADPTGIASAINELLIALALLEIIAVYATLKVVTEPLRLITEAVTHVSKQANDVTPPNVNQKRHERSGLKAVIQTIYELAVGSTHQLDAAAGNQEALSQNATFLQHLLQEVPCGVIALNKDRQVIYANPLAPVKVNPDQEQEVQLLFEQGDSIAEWLNECEASKVRDTHFWSRVANDLPETPNRRIFDVVAYYQKEGSAADTMIVTIDRTADYAPAQEDMDFIALAAHELRGPITVIRGYLDVLGIELDDKLAADQKELFDRLNVSANRLSSYINNILNVSRYDRRHLKLHLHEERLADIVTALNDDLAMRARTQNRILNVKLPDDLPTIAADRHSLSEVITNLVDNAIKYSAEGGQVIVTAEVRGNYVELSVQDFGIGIPSSVMGHLFKRFYRSHRSRSTVSGTGLGLYLAKAIIDSHGGKIWARSTEGQGSTFGFNVPIYSTVAEKLLASDNRNEGIIESSNGWINNHSMHRG